MPPSSQAPAPSPDSSKGSRPPGGWTGIQYSVLRVAIAWSVMLVCLDRMTAVEGRAWPLLGLGIPGAVALALGWRDRAITFCLLVLVGGLAALVDGAPLMLPRSDVIFTTLALVLHFLAPITPFGSWDAAGRIDPRGDWSRPRWLGDLAWLALAIVHAYAGLSRLHEATASGSPLASLPLFAFGGLQILVVLGLVRRSLRAWLWIATTLALIGWWSAMGSGDGAFALLVLHACAAEPGWWPGRRFHPPTEAGSSPARLFYDGDCGFCHRSVRFILSEEANTPDADRLRFAPLSSETFAQAVARREDLDPSTLPDSIVLLLEDGRLLTRSGAVLECASRLGGLWRGIALLGQWIPSGLRDVAYDAVARVRKRLFEAPSTGACPILPPDLRQRFDA